MHLVTELITTSDGYSQHHECLQYPCVAAGVNVLVLFDSSLASYVLKGDQSVFRELFATVSVSPIHLLRFLARSSDNIFPMPAFISLTHLLNTSTTSL